MKKILVSLSGLVLLTIVIAGCTPVPTPDVEITGYTDLGNYEVDSTFAVTSDTVFVEFGDTKLEVKNNVDAIVTDAYVEVYRVTGVDSAIYERTGNVLQFTTTRISPDTPMTIQGLIMDVKPEAESLWTNKSIQSYRLELHFAGEDAYGKHKRFDVYRSKSLSRKGL